MPSVDGGVVDVGVHVPDEVGVDRHEAAARLAQPAGQQQQLAQRPGVVGVVVVVVPLLVDAVGLDQRRRVVAGDDLRGPPATGRTRRPTPRRITSNACSLVAVHRLHGAGRVELAAAWSSSCGQDAAAVVEAVARDGEPHVLLQRRPLPPGMNGGVGGAERAGAPGSCRSRDAAAGRPGRRPAGRGARWSACRWPGGSCRRRGRRRSRGWRRSVSRWTIGLMSWLPSPGT